MGDPTRGDAEAGAREPAYDASREHLDDLARIAESVREVAGAEGALVSRVLDDDWLEVVVVVGTLPGTERSAVQGLRWRRDSLDRSLSEAERLGRLHVTFGGALPYAALSGGDPSGVPGSPETRDVLLAPLRAAEGELLGVLTTVGRIDMSALEGGACELVELHADQARLALDLGRANSALAEQLRMSDAAQSVLTAAAQQPDVTALLGAVAPRISGMVRAHGVWVCAELAGVHTEAASHPVEITEQLGPELCPLIEPLVETCWQGDSTLTHDDSPALSRIAGQAGCELALLASIGSGTTVRGAMLVLRDRGSRPWTDDERDALRGLGRRLGVLVHQLDVRRQDRALLDELRRLDQYRRDLVASITHDLRTPLTAIRLNTELLESHAGADDAGAHPVAAIRRSAERLARLVDDLLALARAEEGMLDRSATEVDAVALLRQACRHSEVEAQARRVTVTVDAPEEVRVVVDGEALARVYGNVVGNAVKFSLPGGEVRVRLRRHADVVEMVCADEGIGIPEQDQAAVFDMVRRGRDRLDGVPGAGIGLAISHRIVTRLGGVIELSSTPGRGSTFTVTVPVTPAGG